MSLRVEYNKANSFGPEGVVNETVFVPALYENTTSASAEVVDKTDRHSAVRTVGSNLFRM